MSDCAPPAATSVQVIERMMRLIDAIAAQTRPMGLKELARHAHLHPSTAHRILSDMVTLRLIERAGVGAYRLGMRLLELGNSVSASIHAR